MAEKEQGYGTRREFLAAVGASMCGACHLAKLRGAPPIKNSKVRLAVVGGGFGSGQYWHEHPQCEVTAVADLVEERRKRLAEAYGCRQVYSSMEAMFDKAVDSFDAVAIFTDPPHHAEHVISALQAGKHVVSAVPMAQTLQDCARIKETVERTGLKYMMHETSYYRQPCIAARELYRSGAFGRLLFSEVEYYHPGVGGKKDTRRRWKGLGNWRYGVPPMLYPTHSLGLLVGVTRERIVKVSCLGQRVGTDFPERSDSPYGNPFNNEMAIGLTDQGNICRFGVFWQVAAHGERGQWLGEKLSCYMALALQQDLEEGKAGADSGQPYGHTMMKEDSGWQKWNVPEYWKTGRLPKRMRHTSGHGGSHTFLSAEFIDSIVKERSPAVDVYEALAMTTPGLIAHQSALQGGIQLEVPRFATVGSKPGPRETE